MSIEPIITKASLLDIDKICLIENQNFKFPWNKKSFEEEIKLSDTNKSKFLVLKIQNEIIGYICCRTMVDEANIINFSIKKEFQNLGYGKKLLKYLLDIVEKENIKNVYLEVRESNIVAQKLYQKLGFKNFVIRKNFYPDNENAIIMYLNLQKKDLKK